MHTLLTEIVGAERAADEILEEARRAAREIEKAVDEANVQMERQAARDLREAARRRLDEAEKATMDEIKALELRRSSQREALKRAAQSRVSQAGARVFERVVSHGDR